MLNTFKKILTFLYNDAILYTCKREFYDIFNRLAEVVNKAGFVKLVCYKIE